MGEAFFLACGFVPGAVGQVCAGVETGLYLIQGDVGKASAAAIGLLGAGAAGQALKFAARQAAKRTVAQLPNAGRRIETLARRAVTGEYMRRTEWSRTAVTNLVGYGTSKAVEPGTTALWNRIKNNRALW